MGLWEVSMRVSYDYPFIQLSRLVPDTPISMWCLWDRELLQVPARDPRVVRVVERSIRAAGHVVDQWIDSGTTRLFLLRCTCGKYDSLWNVFDAHQCWYVPPVVYRDGWANFRVISFDARRPSDLFADLRKRGPAVLVRKRELSLSALPTSVWTNVLFGDLTARQSEALLSAHRFGYYTSPRAVTTEEIAASLGLGRTTFEEHLRKAENRVIAALIPYLEMFTSADRPLEHMPLVEAPVGGEPLRRASA